jgi:hypothetical protein
MLAEDDRDRNEFMKNCANRKMSELLCDELYASKKPVPPASVPESAGFLAGRECRRLVADRVISRARNNQVAFGAKQN